MGGGAESGESHSLECTTHATGGVASCALLPFSTAYCS